MDILVFQCKYMIRIWGEGLSGKESTCQCKRHRFNPWAEKIRWGKMTAHSSILAWEIPRAEELQRTGSQKVRQDWMPTQHSNFTSSSRRKGWLQHQLHRLRPELNEIVFSLRWEWRPPPERSLCSPAHGPVCLGDALNCSATGPHQEEAKWTVVLAAHEFITDVPGVLHCFQQMVSAQHTVAAGHTEVLLSLGCKSRKDRIFACFSCCYRTGPDT